jgi:hypothetical protein
MSKFEEFEEYVKAICPACEQEGKALSYCKHCGEFIPITVELEDDERGGRE